MFRNLYFSNTLRQTSSYLLVLLLHHHTNTLRYTLQHIQLHSYITSRTSPHTHHTYHARHITSHHVSIHLIVISFHCISFHFILHTISLLLPCTALVSSQRHVQHVSFISDINLPNGHYTQIQGIQSVLL